MDSKFVNLSLQKHKITSVRERLRESVFQTFSVNSKVEITTLSQVQIIFKMLL